MKKNFPLQIEGKNSERILEAVKHEIRKYFKRERNRALPKEVEFWDFDCKVGLTADSAAGVKVSAVIESIDALVKEGAASAYVEILSKHGKRISRPENDPVIIERVEDLGFASPQTAPRR